MALRPQLLDDIVRVVTPAFTEAVARIFVFDEWEGTPGFASIYVARKSNPYLLAIEPIASYSRSPRPRREPHIITLGSGDEWFCYKGGCGCGSPIKRLTTRLALADYSKSPLSTPTIPSQELVGG